VFSLSYTGRVDISLSEKRCGGVKREIKFLFGFYIAIKSVEKLHNKGRLRIRHFSTTVIDNCIMTDTQTDR